MEKEKLFLLIIAIVFITGIILYFVNPPVEQKRIECQTDLKICGDGSYVGRVPPDCSFVDCPEQEMIIEILDTSSSTPTDPEAEPLDIETQEENGI